jgi:uracil-DNA glycosylase family 4
MEENGKLINYLKGWTNCSRCEFGRFSKRVGMSFGEGDPNSKLMFIGEWPKNQMAEKEGSCLTDSEKSLLIKVLEFFGTNLQDVFISPMLSCRPCDSIGATKKPGKIHLDSCNPRIDKTLDLVDPYVVVLIGQKAYNTFAKGSTKSTFASLTANPRPIEIITSGVSGIEVRRSAIVIRPLDWVIEKDIQQSRGGDLHRMMVAMQMAFTILDSYNSILNGITPPARQEVIDN